MAVDAVPVSAPINVVAVATPVIYTSSSTHKSVVLVTPVTDTPKPVVWNFISPLKNNLAAAPSVKSAYDLSSPLFLIWIWVPSMTKFPVPDSLINEWVSLWYMERSASVPTVSFTLSLRFNVFSLLSHWTLPPAPKSVKSSKCEVTPETYRFPVVTNPVVSNPPVVTIPLKNPFPVESIPVPLPVDGLNPICNLYSGFVVPIPTSTDVDNPADVIVHAACANPDNSLPSPWNLVAVTTPETDISDAVINPTVEIPPTYKFSFTHKLVVVTIPVTLAVPLTSNSSVGTDVPIPTKPFGFTIKLSLSTCTPLRKLNDFL